MKQYKNIVLAVSAVMIVIIAVSAYILKTSGDNNGLVKLPTDYLEKVSDLDIDSDIMVIRDVLKKIEDKNVYLEVKKRSGESKLVFLNSKGEEYSENKLNGFSSIIRNDGKSVKFAEYIRIEDDLSILGYIKRGVDFVSNKKAILYKDKYISKDEIKNNEYVRYIEVFGLETIKDFFSFMGEEKAEYVIKDIEKRVEGNQDVRLRVTLSYDDNGSLSAGSSFILSGEEYTDWFFSGYIDLGVDWKLEDYWYKLNLEDEEHVILASEMLSRLLVKLDNITYEYAKENNLEIVSNNFGDAGSGDIVRYTEYGHYHADGTFHPNKPIVCEFGDDIVSYDAEGHYHADGSYHKNVYDDGLKIDKDSVINEINKALEERDKKKE